MLCVCLWLHLQSKKCEQYPRRQQVEEGPQFYKEASWLSDRSLEKTLGDWRECRKRLRREHWLNDRWYMCAIARVQVNSLQVTLPSPFEGVLLA